MSQSVLSSLYDTNQGKCKLVPVHAYVTAPLAFLAFLYVNKELAFLYVNNNNNKNHSWP